MKLKIIIAIVLLGLLSYAVGYYYVYVVAAKHEDPLKAENKIQVTAFSLFTNYMTNESAADSLYLDKVINVSGSVENIELKTGRYTMTLASGDSSGGVICEMDTVENTKLLSIVKGRNIKIVGFCNGFLIDVQLDRCRIEE